MMRRHYWSCSRFAEWVRGTAKPSAATQKEWSSWEKKAKQKVFRFWLAEEGLDHLQDILYWPLDQIDRFVHYVRNRWVTKTHSLTSNLKKGEWYDLDHRLLHCVFDELVNFVEIEKAWMEVVFSDENQKKYRTPMYRKIFRFSWRCPEAGIAHLKWEAELRYDSDQVDKNHHSFGQLTAQALAAQEILELYHWWKVKRPKRPDPMDASGWSEYCAQRESCIEFMWEDESEEERQKSREILDASFKIEREHEEEDTQMLIRLVKIRHSLWT